MNQSLCVLRQFRSIAAAALLAIVGNATGATVGPAGYTNAFATQPPAGDWATLSVAGSSGDTYTPDADVNATITASGVTAQTTSSTGNPPSALAIATWSSAGLYLQTRPTGNRYTVLMGKFVNNSGTNATQVTLSYGLTIAGAAGFPEETGKGTRVYYSLAGLANSWINVPALNQTLSTNGFFPYLLQLPLNWTNGGSLFFLWVDDNTTGTGIDSADQLDNFSLQVTAGSPLSLNCTLTAPGSNSVFVSGTTLTAAASVVNGTPPYTVEYFTNSGAGNTLFASAGSSGTAPYNVSPASLPVGTYNIYAMATDSAGNPAGSRSTTNTFFIADPIVVTLDPVSDATFDNATDVAATATVFGGSAPYSVRFDLDGAASGGPVNSTPYQHNFGALFVGDHTIGATVTDARGWVSNSLVSVVHITGPLGVILTPTNGASYNFGQSVSLDASAGGGTAPYTVTFYTNGQVAGSLGLSPFTTSLGVLPVGRYTNYVDVVDSSSPIQQQADSTTNVLTILANPLVVSLTSPINGLTISAGQPLALAANVTVGAPVTVSNVEFFFDGASVAVDSMAPYSGSVASPAAGSHTVYAAASDSLGRKSYSATNQVTAVSVVAGSNNYFTNAIPLSGLFVTTTGSNGGATRESGEPSHGGFGGAHSVWWSWTAPDSGLTTIDTFGSSFDTLLGVYVGNAVNALTTIGSNDDYFSGSFFSSQSLVQFNAIAGTVYRIAVDGYSGSSGTITLHIAGPNGVSISSPADGAVFTLGDPIPFTVNISTNFPNPPATRVDFYRGGVRFASSTNSPFTAVATNAPLGTNSFYAVALSSTSQSYTSATLNVFVQNVGVTLLLPLDGSYLDFGTTNPITVTAWAYLPSGSITNIEFFVDGQKFGQDATPPFSATWINVVGGSHRLTAIGRSDTGASYASQPVLIAVYRTLLPVGAPWEYLDNGSNQGTNWIAPNFDDSGWATGPSPLGYSDSNGRFPATTNSFGPDPNNKFITTYYRQSSVITNLASYIAFYVYVQRDDGVVLYLNGTEIFRNNVPNGSITYTTLASASASDDGSSTYGIAPSRALFVEGTNVLAAEIHQNVANTPDSWFQLQLFAAPAIIRNLSPIVAIGSPTNNEYFLAPSNITLIAGATDPDGSIARVEFFADGIKLGETNNAPYRFDWNNPPLGPHSLTAVATDDQDASQQSAAVHIDVYNSAGAPFVRITSPADGTAVEGGTNLLISAYASAPSGVSNVQFFANGALIYDDSSVPFSLVWDAPFGTNVLTAVAYDTIGVSAISVPVRLTVFPNTLPPTIATQAPPRGVTLTNFASLLVTFSERVQNVDASDLIVSGIPATGVSGSGSNYIFTFPQPHYGEVEIAWANGHGITDFGYPSNLPFNALSPDAQWEYQLIDRTPPAIAARFPAAGSTVTNVAQISVVFSEVVTNVDASDLLINGTPALGLIGTGSNFTFSVAQPAAGTVNVTWAANHGIVDLAETPNAFNGTNTNARWSFTLDLRVVLVQSNSTWRMLRGFSEASTPNDAWRQRGFNDSSWSNSAAPFFYGDPYNNDSAGIAGTLLNDMQDNYTSIFLRKEFTASSLGAITNLVINHQSDDGFIAWLNGIEVLRYNVPAGDLPYNAVASSAVNEPNNTGAAYIVATLANNAVARLVAGTNILAVHAFNQSLSASSDFGFNAQLYYFPVDASAVPPRIVSAEPAPGDVIFLTNVIINFSEGVAGVDAGDLLVNGVPATGVSSTTNATYTFSFPQPAFGPVLVTWATNQGIADLDSPPKTFDGAAANATVSYTLINPDNPRIASQTPLAGMTVTGLTSITVAFTEPVAGVAAADLLVGGVPASAVSSGDNVTYTFSFAQPPFGAVAIRWAADHGITDMEVPPNSFDPTRFGGQWSYTLVDPVPSITLTSPTNNAYILAPATILLRASASDNDGTIALVEFFEGARKLGESTNTPYAATWSNVLEGVYSLRAVATDDSGLSRTSAPVVISVVTSLPIFLVRGPYLQIGSPTGGVVRWRTDAPSDGVVSYGTDPAGLTNLAMVSGDTIEHIVPIAGLQPDTKYFYTIGSSSQWLAGTNGAGSDYWFNTSPVPGTTKPTRFWVLGDSGTANNNARNVRNAYYRFAATNRPADFWLMLGDNAYQSGFDTEYQSAVFDMYPDTLRNLFLWPTIGNHESDQSFSSEDFPYLDIFSLPPNGEAGGVPSGTQKYYSFDYANIHFICLDSMTSGRATNTAMVQWLENDLASTGQEWLIAFFHHPPYTRGNHNSDEENELIEIRENILPILEANGVDLVLNGHSHALERSYLLNGHYGYSSTLSDSMKLDGGDGREDGTGAYHKDDQGRGTVYSVSGSSGQITGGSLNHPAHFISMNVLGSLIVDVAGPRLDVNFLGTNGAYLDHYTLMKPSPVAPLNLVVQPTSSTEVRLAWTDATAIELGFSIERSLDGINFTEQFTAPANATNALDSGLLANTTYFYRVRATNAAGASDYSNIAGATTIMPTSAPGAPIALTASSGSGGAFYRSQMVLRWQDRSTNEAGFQIERSAEGASFVPVSTVGANITHFLDHNLASATAYYYRVRAFNALGLSAPTGVAGDSTHPQSQLATGGQDVTIHGGVEGEPPVAYQWRFLGNPLSGQTNEALVLSNVQSADEGNYSVLITDASGSQVSNPAYLFVVTPPRIVVPPRDRTNLVGSVASLAVVAEGTAPFTYRWRKDGALMAGAASPTLTFANVQFSDRADYDVIVENDFGSVTSQVARLVVFAPPLVANLPDMLAEVLKTLIISNIVSDPNDPPILLAYSLAAGAPTNAFINPSNGQFRWTPDRGQGGSSNAITVRVASGSFLSNAVSFNVFVNDYTEVTVGSTVMLAGNSNSVPIDLFSSGPLTSLQCALRFPGERLNDMAVETLTPNLATLAMELPDVNTAALTFTPAEGTFLQGTQRLARLHFKAITNPASAFLFLEPGAINLTRATAGQPPTSLVKAGRVVVIGGTPLVELSISPTGQRGLRLYGRPGTNYTIEQSSTVTNKGPWTFRGRLLVGTNLTGSVSSLGPPPSPEIFYRARE